MQRSVYNYIQNMCVQSRHLVQLQDFADFLGSHHVVKLLVSYEGRHSHCFCILTTFTQFSVIGDQKMYNVTSWSPHGSVHNLIVQSHAAAVHMRIYSVFLHNHTLSCRWFT